MHGKTVFCKLNKVRHPYVRKDGLERDLVFLLFCFVRVVPRITEKSAFGPFMSPDPFIDGNLYF